VHGFAGNLEVEAENPRSEAFFERLGSAGRVIRFDRRGTGLSDRVREVPTLEARMDDLRAVMDAVQSSRAVVLATFEAASMAMVYAATYPERVAGLAVYNAIARGSGRRTTLGPPSPRRSSSAGSSRSGRVGALAALRPTTFAKWRRPSPTTRRCRNGGHE
jgi:pimeloyl-ACP methyl ester carboxylesterase